MRSICDASATSLTARCTMAVAWAVRHTAATVTAIVNAAPMMPAQTSGKVTVLPPPPEAYRGLDRYDARKKILQELEALDLLVKVEDVKNTLPYGDRSGVVIEPWLTDQWYVDAHKLAQPALKAVREGKTSFIPKNWEKTYFEWLENIQPNRW